MRTRVALALALVLSSLVAAREALAQQPLPITRVLLYKNGMAYIVRSGELTTPVSLTFHPDDMNDVLKSFTAWNPATNALYSVGYTAGIPSSHLLGRFPFNVAGSDVGLGAFLMQVKGAAIRVAAGPASSTVQGTLVAVQQAPHPIGTQSMPDHRLTMMLRDGSLRTVWLGEMRSVTLVDPQLREQLRTYLEVLAEGRQDVTRQVTVYPNPAAGPVRAAYLQQFPLWKTSYRVDLGDKDGAIQGWAQIDNPTGESWNNVEVSLLSGSPASFKMNLYDPLYTNRSTMTLPGSQVAAPRQYQAAIKSSPTLERAVMDSPPPTRNIQGMGQLIPGVNMSRAEALTVTGAAPFVDVQSATTVRGQSSATNVVMVDGMVTQGVELNGALAAYFAQAESSQVEDFFEYRFPFPVQLGSRQSALLPFVQKKLEVERLSIFNAGADRGHPRLGAYVRNTTGVPFEPGPITFFQTGRYSGETVLDYLPRNERRLVSYGIDNEVHIVRMQVGVPERRTRLTIANGIAVYFTESGWKTTYAIRNTGEKKTIVVEHPRDGQRKLRMVEEPYETTEGFYRFKLTVEPGATIDLPVEEIGEERTEVSLSSLERGEMLVLSQSAMPSDVVARLEAIVDLRESIAAVQLDLVALEAKRAALLDDQSRLRENLKALGGTREDQDLRKRYLAGLARQEDTLRESMAAADACNQDISERRKQLAALIADIAFNER